MGTGKSTPTKLMGSFNAVGIATQRNLTRGTRLPKPISMVLAVMGTQEARLLTRAMRGTDQDETTSNKIRHNEKAYLCVSCVL